MNSVVCYGQNVKQLQITLKMIFITQKEIDVLFDGKRFALRKPLERFEVWPKVIS